MEIINTKFYDWFVKNLSEYAKDLEYHGAVNGVPGLTYYSETNAVYDQFEEEIFDIVEEYAQDFYGFSGLRLVSNFKSVGSLTTFKNQMVWLAIEFCAHAHNEMEEAV